MISFDQQSQEEAPTEKRTIPSPKLSDAEEATIDALIAYINHKHKAKRESGLSQGQPKRKHAAEKTLNNDDHKNAATSTSTERTSTPCSTTRSEDWTCTSKTTKDTACKECDHTTSSNPLADKHAILSLPRSKQKFVADFTFYSRNRPPTKIQRDVPSTQICIHLPAATTT